MERAASTHMQLQLPSPSPSLSDTIREQLRPCFAAYRNVHGSTNGTTGGMYALIMPHMEKPLIELALEHSGGNQLKAAEMLGINRNTLRKKIRVLNITISK